MYGNILLGSTKIGDTQLGLSVAEVQANLSESTNGTLIRCIAVMSSLPATLRIPELDLIVNLSADNDRHIPKFGVGIYGNFDEFGTTAVAGLGIGVESRFMVSKVNLTSYQPVGIRVLGSIAHVNENDNAISWSDVNSLDFTQTQGNVAGTMPVDFKGYVYAVERLGDSNLIYLYGANGIVRISPSGVFYGSQKVSDLGIKSKHAVVNTGKEHFFIDVNDVLYRISGEGKATRLGYQEYLSTLGDVVMSYDAYEKSIYICDGTNGYLYSLISQSFSKGPSNVTGIQYQSGTQYVVANAAITTPDFLLVTDIYDMGSKKEKTILELMISTNDTTNLTAAIEYRVFPTASFVATPWINVNPHGIVKLPCYGREFKFKFTGNTGNAEFKIDAIQISGIMHGYNFLDTLSFK